MIDPQRLPYPHLNVNKGKVLKESNKLDLEFQKSVHHIKLFIFHNDYKEANQLSNLISVCEPCHRKIHSGELHPSKYI